MKREENKLPLGIRMGCWLCKAGIRKKFCLICPPVAEEARKEQEHSE